jgi:hypothetical protein
VKLTRRQFLAALSATSVAPMIFVPRASRAQQQAAQTTRAKQLLIIYAGGGMRGHALFSFDGAPKQLNPFGVAGSPGSAKAAFRLASPVSGNTDTAPFQQSPELLPEWGKNLPTLFGPTLEQFSLLGPVDHNPDGPPEVDERRAKNLISTGRADGGPGLLTIIGNKLPTPRPLPPFCIGDEAAIFGRVTSGLEAGAPVFIRDPLDVGADLNAYGRLARDSVAMDGSHVMVPATAQEQWEIDLGNALDGSLKNQLPKALAPRLDRVIGSRAQLKAVQEVLSRPQLRFKSDANATASFENSNGVPLSNRRLEQAFLPFVRFQTGGLTTNSNFNDPVGAKLAMAVRLLQYGSPAVAVGFGGFDLHKDEDKLLHTVSRPLGRAIAALLFVLGGMPGVEAKRRLDEVLVVVVSEWGRDSVRDDTGFNDQGGSDHRGGPSSRFQILPIFGAGVKGGRIIGGFTPDVTLKPTTKTYSTAALSATLLNALGVDSRPFISADPFDDPFQ